MTYDLSNIDDLVAFDRDCATAINECPQQRSVRPIVEAYDEISVAMLFRLLFKHDTLWNRGWHEYLTPKAKTTFNRYALFIDGRVLDSVTGKVFYQSDTFRVKFKPEAARIK